MNTSKNHEGGQREILPGVFNRFCRFCRKSPILTGRNDRLKPGKLLT